MYFSEKAFIMSFIACLARKGKTTIMLNDTDYYKGLENMRQYFQVNRENMGSVSNELAMLFLKNSNGKYCEFDTAIENLNAGLLSFDNPYYITAHIKVDISDAQDILEENKEYISVELIEGFATAFCSSN